MSKLNKELEELLVKSAQHPLAYYFPDCVIPTCPLSDTLHQHILPHQAEIMDYGFFKDHKSYLYCQGGVGSAKSVAFAARTVREMIEICENEGVVVRKDYEKLYRSAWKDIKQVVKRLVKRKKIAPPTYSTKKQGDYTKILFHGTEHFDECGSELYAVQAKNWSEGLGSSYGVFWVDDAMECPEGLFLGDGEVNAGLLSRLRLPHVAFHRVLDYELLQEDVVNRLIGLVSSNPPPVNSWLHKLFGKEPGDYWLGDDEVHWMQVNTLTNPFVGENYAKGLVAVQKKMGRKKAIIDRIIAGESKPAYGGVPVFPEFDHSKHVADIKFDPSLPLVVSIDFGFLHPAICYSNLFRCKYGRHHYLNLTTLAEPKDINVWKLWEEHEKHMKQYGYNKAKHIAYGGDKAGYRRSSSNKDSRGDIPIIYQDFGIKVVFKKVGLEESLNYCRSLLDSNKKNMGDVVHRKYNGKSLCECGMQMIQVDHNNEELIGALEGGYLYPVNREGLTLDKPREDRYFADIACAWRYGAENFVRKGIPYVYEEDVIIERPRARKPWEWMEMSDSEIGKLLTR